MALGEPKPVLILGVGLIGFSIAIDSLYGFFKGRPALQLFMGSQYLELQNVAFFTFILLGLGTLIIAWNRWISKYGYYGVLVSLVVFSGIWYFVLYALGVY